MFFSLNISICVCKKKKIVSITYECLALFLLDNASKLLYVKTTFLAFIHNIIMSFYER